MPRDVNENHTDFGARSKNDARSPTTTWSLLRPCLHGNWNFNVLHSFGGSAAPGQSLGMDAAGNLYGTTSGDRMFAKGTVFKLTHSNGSWTYSSLHDFSGSDGWGPVSNVVLDANGNLYGTASSGGAYGFGVVWEITPKRRKCIRKLKFDRSTRLVEM